MTSSWSEQAVPIHFARASYYRRHARRDRRLGHRRPRRRARARAAARRHDVRGRARPGGHVYTVDADGHAIDMGFIVCNRERYPHFCALLDELGIATRPTTMSFSVVARRRSSGAASRSSAMFADRRRLVDPRHWRFLVEVVALPARARERDLDARDARPRAHRSTSTSRARRVSRDVRERFVVPLAAALWSLAPERCGEFPAVTYLRFLDQHGMLSPIAAARVAHDRRRQPALRRRAARAAAARERSRCASRRRSRAIERDADGVTIVARDGASTASIA